MLVFISHSSVDKPFVRKLNRALRHRGLETWLDEAEIRVGDSIPLAISNALDRTSVFCLVLSRASTTSPWVNRELHSTAGRWINGDVTLVPCLVEDCSRPALLRDIKYADFRGDFSRGIQDILSARDIHEELALGRAAKMLVEELIATQKTPDLAFFVHYFSKKNFYMVHTDMDHTYPAMLEALDKIGALAILTDRHEWLYRLTPLGERMLDHSWPQEVVDLVEKWNAE
jgi:hypothetical protein